MSRRTEAERRIIAAQNAITLDESTFQSQVVELAGILGWKHLHVRRTRGRGGAWVTSTNRSGWPDLFFWHPTRPDSFYAELKSAAGELRPDQVEVLAELDAAGLETHVWRPADFDEVRRRLSGQRLHVTWAPAAVQAALDEVLENTAGPDGLAATIGSQNVDVIVDALRAAGGAR